MTPKYALVVVVLLIWLLSVRKPKPKSKIRYDNNDDIQLLKGGTMEFEFQGVVYKGTVSDIQYVPAGPGGIDVQLISIEADGRRPIPDTLLSFTFSFFMAEVVSSKGKLSIRQLVPQLGFGGKFTIYEKVSES